MYPNGDKKYYTTNCGMDDQGQIIYTSPHDNIYPQLQPNYVSDYQPNKVPQGTHRTYYDDERKFIRSEARHRTDGSIEDETIYDEDKRRQYKQWDEIPQPP